MESPNKQIKHGLTERLGFSLVLSSQGHLSLMMDAENSETLPQNIADKIQIFFTEGNSVGLLRLGMTRDLSLP